VLVELDLRWNQIEDLGASAVANMLVKNKSIRTVNLRSNRIQDKGSSVIAIGIKKNKVITKIALNGNSITRGSAALDSIAAVLTANTLRQARGDEL
jgi:Ran GTPase-activating protein (RanGAP) involved in mRNA processing and transport